MPPSRTSKRQRPDAEEEDDAADRPVGVNKLKSQIRQTKRLLASDRITPDIRQETERRLVALELDLETAERKKVETSRAARYHRVKFFERQKVVRRLHQVLKALEKGKAPEGDKKAAKELAKLTKELKHLRIDLNYIINYPKAQKYVSLYPDGTYAPHTKLAASHPSSDAFETPAASIKDPDGHRARVRADIEGAMERGELSAEPEKWLAERGDQSKEVEGHSKTKARQPVPTRTVATAPGLDKKAKATSKKPKRVEQEEVDEFFA